MSEPLPPSLYEHLYTGEFYFALDPRPDGTADTKYDCTEAVQNIVRDAREPLVTAIEDALSVAEMEGHDLSLSPWCDLRGALELPYSGEPSE